MKSMTATPPAAMPMMAPNERGTVLKNKASFKQHSYVSISTQVDLRPAP